MFILLREEDGRESNLPNQSAVSILNDIFLNSKFAHNKIKKITMTLYRFANITTCKVYIGIR